MAKYTVAVCDDEKEDSLTSSLRSKLIQMENYFLTN